MLLKSVSCVNHVLGLGVEKGPLIFTAWSPTGKSITAEATEFESSSEKAAVRITQTKSWVCIKWKEEQFMELALPETAIFRDD